MCSPVYKSLNLKARQSNIFFNTLVWLYSSKTWILWHILSKTTPRSMMVVLLSSSNLNTIYPCSCVNIAASGAFISGYNLAIIPSSNMKRTVWCSVSHAPQGRYDCARLSSKIIMIRWYALRQPWTFDNRHLHHHGWLQLKNYPIESEIVNITRLSAVQKWVRVFGLLRVAPLSFPKSQFILSICCAAPTFCTPNTRTVVFA